MLKIFTIKEFAFHIVLIQGKIIHMITCLRIILVKNVSFNVLPDTMVILLLKVIMVFVYQYAHLLLMAP